MLKVSKSQEKNCLQIRTPKNQQNILHISALAYKKWFNQKKIKHCNMLDSLISVLKCFYILIQTHFRGKGRNM